MPELLDRPSTPLHDLAAPAANLAKREPRNEARQPAAITLGRHPRRSRRELTAWLGFFGLLATGTWLGVPDTAATPWTDTLEVVSMLGFMACLLVAPFSLLLDIGRTLHGAPRPRRWVWVRAAVAGAAFLLPLQAIGLEPTVGCGGGSNEGLRQQVSQIQVALEDYAQAHAGRYPDRANWIAELTAEPGPLHGQALPRTRWGTAGQTAVLAPAALGLPGADEPAAIANVRPMQVLPHGQAPDGAPGRPDDFGAVLYDLDPKTQTYVLYCIGKRYRHAELVAYFSNADLDGSRMGPPAPETP